MLFNNKDIRVKNFCLCWGFTAQSTQWGHVERGQFTYHTFTGQAQSSKRLTSNVHILLPETDNCPSWISGRERMTVENISWSNLHERMLPTQGVEPTTSWSPVRRASNWATETGLILFKSRKKPFRTLWYYPCPAE